MLQAKALAPIIANGGAVLLISSATVGSPRADALIYSGTKAAVRQAARSLATELAPRKIRVNVIAPGATETNFHSRGGMSADAQKSYKENGGHGPTKKAWASGRRRSCCMFSAFRRRWLHYWLRTSGRRWSFDGVKNVSTLVGASRAAQFRSIRFGAAGCGKRAVLAQKLSNDA